MLPVERLPEAVWVVPRQGAEAIERNVLSGNLWKKLTISAPGIMVNDMCVPRFH